MSPNPTLRDGWRKSTRSNNSGNGQDCVEVRSTSAAFEIRDSKLGAASPILSLGRADFRALVARAVTSPVRAAGPGTFEASNALWIAALEEGESTGLLEIGFADNGMVALRLVGGDDLLVYTASEWNAFSEGARLGEFEPEVLEAELIPA